VQESIARPRRLTIAGNWRARFRPHTNGPLCLSGADYPPSVGGPRKGRASPSSSSRTRYLPRIRVAQAGRRRGGELCWRHPP